MQQALHISEELHFAPLPVICLPHVSEWVIGAGEIPPNSQIRNGRSCRFGQTITAMLLPDLNPLCHAALMTLDCRALDIPLPASSSRFSTVPLLDKMHSPSRTYSSLGTQASGKAGNSDREEGNKDAGVPTQPSNAFRSRSWPSCTSIPGLSSANLLHNLPWIMQSFSAH